MHDSGLFHKEKMQDLPFEECFFSHPWEVNHLSGIFNLKGFFLSGCLEV